MNAAEEGICKECIELHLAEESVPIAREPASASQYLLLSVFCKE